MKKLISILITALLLTTILYAVPAFAAVDPYQGFSAVNFDGSKVGNTFQMNNGGLGGMYNSHYVYYKDVDFGEVPPVSVTVSIGVPESYVGRIELCLDSPSNPAIASIVPLACNWTTPLNNTVELMQVVSGKHDLYLVVKENTCDIYSIKFNLPASEGIYQEYRENDKFSDIKDNRYRKEILLITDLSFMEEDRDGIFNPQMVVTRGEFVKYLHKIFGEVEMPYEAYYSDIAQDSPYAKSVTALAANGILSREEEKFHPYAYITPYDAATMLAGVLGYTELFKADSKKLPAIIASEGLLSGFNEEYLRRDACAALLYRGLQAEYADVTTIGDSVTYTRKKDGILKLTKGISKGKGVVNQTCLTGLYSPVTDLPEGKIAVNDVVFFAGDTRGASYLGYECEYYYITDDVGNRTLLAIRPTGNMKTLLLEDTCVESISSRKIEYRDENGKEKFISLASDTRFIYNGKALDKSLAATMSQNRFQGDIRIVSRSGKYETVFINEYANVIISGVDSNGILHDELSGQIFDLEAYELVLQRDGENITAADIQKGDVGVVYASKNQTGEQLVRAYFSSERISGSITASEFEEGIHRIWIDDEGYTVGQESTDTYSVGTYAEFYVNIYGEVLGFTFENAQNILVGLLVDYDKGRQDLSEEGFGMKLMDASGKEVTLKSAKNIVIDGVKRKSKAEFQSAFSSVDMNTPVRYALNASGAVRMLDTYQSATVGNSNDILTRLTPSAMDFVFSISNRLLLLYGNGRGAWAVTKEAKVFSLWAGCEVSDMTIEPIRNLSGDGVKTGMLYSLNGDKNFGDIFVWQNRQAEYEYPFVYENQAIVSENDEIFYKLIGYRGAAEVEYKISEEMLSSNASVRTIVGSLRTGDVIRVSLNGTGFVNKLELVFLRDAGEQLTNDIFPLIHKNNPLSGDSLQYHRFMYATVSEKTDNFLKLSYTDASGATINELANVEGVGVCAYEMRGSIGQLRTGLSYANINVGDKVLTYARNAGTKLIVIYEHSHTVQ